MKAPPKSFDLTNVIEWKDGQAVRLEDYLSAEEPLEIRVNRKPLAVTMRTPGHDLELVTGFLLSEGVIQDWEDVSSEKTLRSASKKSNRLNIDLRDGTLHSTHVHGNFITNAGCGLCGRSSIESIRTRNFPPLAPDFVIDPEILCGLPDRLRFSQTVFSRTGGLHAAALFRADGELMASREDIGRHNAVDKVIGWACINKQLPLSNTVLMVSGRGGFEIAQKALAASIPVLASVSAPSSLAVKLAREFGLTMIGFLRGRRFVIYSGAERCLPQEASGETITAYPSSHKNGTG